jgi:hypothetical protein
VSFVDERADNADAESTDGALFPRHVQIRLGAGERIECAPVVDEIDRQPAVPPTEPNSDAAGCRSIFVTVGDDIGEELFENDEKPSPFFVGKTATARERLGKGSELRELCAVAA